MMSNSSNTDPTTFGISVAVHRDDIKAAKFDIIKERRRRAGSDLGRAIAEQKTWRMEPVGEMAVSTLEVIVLTRAEYSQAIAEAVEAELDRITRLFPPPPGDIKNRKDPVLFYQDYARRRINELQAKDGNHVD